jgi:hypothetical protein
VLTQFKTLRVLQSKQTLTAVVDQLQPFWYSAELFVPEIQLLWVTRLVAFAQ